MTIGIEADDTCTDSEVRGLVAAAGLARRDAPFGTSVLVGGRAGEPMMRRVNAGEARWELTRLGIYDILSRP